MIFKIGKAQTIDLGDTEYVERGCGISGYLYGKDLSSVLSMAVQPMTKFRKFSNAYETRFVSNDVTVTTSKAHVLLTV